jgi:hypothetical protein
MLHGARETPLHPRPEPRRSARRPQSRRGAGEGLWGRPQVEQGGVTIAHLLPREHHVAELRVEFRFNV